MPDLKISELTALTTPDDVDVAPIVDTSETQTKKITWANIKATLKTYMDALYAPFENHKVSHQNGGNDEISVAGLSGELADDQPPKDHSGNHENTGGDEISVAGLSGLLADDQNPVDHKDSHDPSGGDPLDTAAAANLDGVQAGAEGSAESFARSDHAHRIQHSIADNAIATIDDADAADNDYAKFTANGLEGREYAEVIADLSLEIGVDVLAQQTIGIADDNLLEVDGSPNSGEYARFTANGLEGRTEAEFKADYNLQIGTDVLAQQAIGIADNNLLEVDDGDAADNDYAKFTGGGLEGRSYAEVKADLSLEDADINALIVATKIDDLTKGDDNTTLDATTNEHGLLPKLGGGTVNFLRADGSWAVPPGGGGGDLTTIEDGSIMLPYYMSEDETEVNTGGGSYITLYDICRIYIPATASNVLLAARVKGSGNGNIGLQLKIGATTENTDPLAVTGTYGWDTSISLGASLLNGWYDCEIQLRSISVSAYLQGFSLVWF